MHISVPDSEMPVTGYSGPNDNWVVKTDTASKRRYLRVAPFCRIALTNDIKRYYNNLSTSALKGDRVNVKILSAGN